MKLAFCLYHYTPFGGLQRDFMQIAAACSERGHQIHVFTTAWQGEHPQGWQINCQPAQGLSNHRRMQNFATQMQQLLKAQSFDGIIGFNKMPGLDIYYAADICWQRKIPRGLAWLPRYRTYQQLEAATFGVGGADILAISPLEKMIYQNAYHTPTNRLHDLTPGLTLDRQYPDNAPQIRATLRAQYQLKSNDRLLIMVGSHFKTKGVDRAIRAMHALPVTLRQNSQLWILGQGDARPFIKLSQSLGVAKQLLFLGARNDVRDHILAADCLLQPSYVENTGTAIIEAMHLGCPVLASGACGFAPWVKEANAGMITNEPFTQPQFNHQLAEMLDAKPHQRLNWGEHGRQFAARLDLFNFGPRAAQLIEQILATRME